MLKPDAQISAELREGGMLAGPNPGVPGGPGVLRGPSCDGDPRGPSVSLRLVSSARLRNPSSSRKGLAWPCYGKLPTFLQSYASKPPVSGGF